MALHTQFVIVLELRGGSPDCLHSSGFFLLGILVANSITDDSLGIRFFTPPLIIMSEQVRSA